MSVLLLPPFRSAHHVFLHRHLAVPILRSSILLRLSSTSTSITPAATRIIQHPSLNPPSSTLPPPLVLPVRTPNQSTFSFYFALGKAYLTFYRTGGFAVWQNWKLAFAIRERLEQSPATSSRSSPPSTALASASSSALADAALAARILSRADWQLLRRSRQDVARVPWFALVLLVFGEFTPLLAPFLTAVVPRTCRVPAQVASERVKAEARRGLSFRTGTLVESGRTPETVGSMSPAQVVHVGRSVGLFPKMLDRVGYVPVGIAKRRAERWVEYLRLDDQAIEDWGGVDKMEMEEVRISLEERGVDLNGRNDTQLRSLLKDWLKARKIQPTTTLLLTRPFGVEIDGLS